MKYRLLPTALCASLAIGAAAQPFATRSNIIRVQRSAANGRALKTAKTTLAFDPALEPFYHGVASGNPSTTSVLLWTRATPPNPSQISVSGAWQLSTDTGFTSIVQNGTFTTDTAKDYTVKIEVTGLTAGTTYFYRFNALGKNSLVGRAKTTPASGIQHLKFGIVSCSNYEGGYFNAYRQLAARNDLDAVVHLGDYIYEYGAGTYGIQLPNRVNEPGTEILTLSDYRTRYSLYRLDKDLIRLHQQHTFINVWDDHESANDSWTDGAENHNPATEGPWPTRKAISKRVYFEWMPIKPLPLAGEIYRKVAYGNMADLVMLDTRLEGRQQPPANYDDPDNGPQPRRIMSQTQQDWFTGNLRNSTARWKVVGNQLLYSIFNVGFAAGYSDGIPNPTNADSIRAAENLFIDNWESYPRQRKAILDTIKNTPNVVFVTGDSHSSWAFDIPDTAVNYPNPAFQNLPTPKPYNATTRSGYNGATQQGSWAVEYGTPSISSPNFDEAVGATTSAVFEVSINNPIAQLGGVNYNPHLRGVDLDRHGFFILDLKQDSLHADFYYVSRIDTNAGYTLQTGPAFRTDWGSNKVSPAAAPAPPKTTQDVPTPLVPQGATGIRDAQGAVLFGVYPNPATNELFVHLGLQQSGPLQIAAYGLDGKLDAVLLPEQMLTAGVYNLRLDLGGIRAAGTYVVQVKGAGVTQSFKLTVVR